MFSSQESYFLEGRSAGVASDSPAHRQGPAAARAPQGRAGPGQRQHQAPVWGQARQGYSRARDQYCNSTPQGESLAPGLGLNRAPGPKGQVLGGVPGEACQGN